MVDTAQLASPFRAAAVVRGKVPLPLSPLIHIVGPLSPATPTLSRPSGAPGEVAEDCISKPQRRLVDETDASLARPVLWWLVLNILQVLPHTRRPRPGAQYSYTLLHHHGRSFTISTSLVGGSIRQKHRHVFLEIFCQKGAKRYSSKLDRRPSFVRV